jgi:hypothetical protein
MLGIDDDEGGGEDWRSGLGGEIICWHITLIVGLSENHVEHQRTSRDKWKSE